MCTCAYHIIYFRHLHIWYITNTQCIHTTCIMQQCAWCMWCIHVVVYSIFISIFDSMNTSTIWKLCSMSSYQWMLCASDYIWWLRGWTYIIRLGWPQTAHGSSTTCCGLIKRRPTNSVHRTVWWTKGELPSELVSLWALLTSILSQFCCSGSHE